MESQLRKLLLADNNEGYRRSLRPVLELDNIEVEEAGSVEEAFQLLDTMMFDLVLADVRLTDDNREDDISGMEIAKKAKGLRTPCIIITAYPSVEIARLALSSRGAEALAVDMALKKDGARAILDAIKIVLARPAQPEARPAQLTAPDLVVDLTKKLVFFKGEQVHLSKNQYAFVAYLYEKKETLVEDTELSRTVYGQPLTKGEVSKDDRLDRLAERIRKKFREDLGHPRYLVKEQGRGFMLVPSGQEIRQNSPE